MPYLRECSLRYLSGPLFTFIHMRVYRGSFIEFRKAVVARSILNDRSKLCIHLDFKGSCLGPDMNPSSVDGLQTIRDVGAKQRERKS